MHVPVLLQEIIQALQPRDGGIYLDATVGAGGHAAALLTASAPAGRLYGFDQDADALDIARQNLATFGDRAHLYHGNFRQLAQLCLRYQVPAANGLLLDLGVSSMQFDRPERGFSFQSEGPLDMRMNQATGESAAELVNALSEKDLANLIYHYGEEPQSRRIARAIVQNRPVHTTVQLADIIAGAIKWRGKRRPKIHPATRTFQALRIAVNDELGVLETVLPQALSLLQPAGRLAVITFHSLEDRIVKQFFRREAQDCICPPEQLLCICRHKAIINIISKKPISPTSAEIEVNPRARSAKLRVVELKGDKHYVK
jgi:16S rRNA (cytosine1402-N4)-methyltransferase